MPNNYYPFLPKNSSRDSFRTVGDATHAYAEFGEIISGSYPLTSTIDVYRYNAASGIDYTRRKIYALKNSLNSYKFVSPHYNYSSSLGNKEEQEINLISIPSIFYGSSIDKGSVQLSFYVSGTLIGKVEDVYKNGELIQTTGSNGSGSVAGVVMYNEGFIILTGSWNLDNSHTEDYIYNPDLSITSSNPKWIYWGAGLGRNPNTTISSSYDLKFEGINYVHTLTMLAHAEKGELNHSNNPTYIKHQNGFVPSSVTKNSYSEFNKNEIKNTVKYKYENHVGDLEKQTFISKIGIYDENKNLIAIAKLARPIKKSENRSLTFKLKLDI